MIAFLKQSLNFGQKDNINPSIDREDLKQNLKTSPDEIKGTR